MSSTIIVDENGNRRKTLTGINTFGEGLLGFVGALLFDWLLRLLATVTSGCFHIAAGLTSRCFFLLLAIHFISKSFELVSFSTTILGLLLLLLLLLLIVVVDS